MDKEEVNHPSHYNHGKFEAIAVIRDWDLNFNLGNAVKYICRAGHKGNYLKDLKKALWYIQDEINFIDGAPSTQFQQISHTDAYELGKAKQFDHLKKFDPKFFKIGIFEHEKLWGYHDKDLNIVVNSTKLRAEMSFVDYWVNDV